MAADQDPDFMLQLGKVPIASEAGWRYDAARHRLPVRCSKLIGEPGHTKPYAARLRPGVSNGGLFLGVRFSVH